MSRTRITWPQHNRERWFVSYADFVTLLFALFVVLFAVSQKDKGRAGQISASVEKVLSGRVSAPLPHRAGSAAKVEQPAIQQQVETLPDVSSTPPAAQSPVAQTLRPDQSSLQRSAATLRAELADEITAGKLRVSLEQRGLVVSLDAGAFFRKGDDRISPSDGTLAKLGQFLSSIDNPLRLEGHTDSLPIRTSRFQSNWELSAARSIAMLRFLADHFGIDSGRMAIVGYADTAASESNQSEEGREKNRRVDVVILNGAGAPQDQMPKGLN